MKHPTNETSRPLSGSRQKQSSKPKQTTSGTEKRKGTDKAASLTEEERDYWRENFKAPSDTELQEQQIVQRRVIPEAFDSHFHLDRTLRDMFLPADGTVEDILQQAPVDDDKRISLVGAIAICCDPDTYPTESLHLKLGLNSLLRQL